MNSSACRRCHNPFEVTAADLDFYQKISPVFAGQTFSIPAPAHCPDCRLQRRLSYRNEYAYYQRRCDRCRKDIISVYSPNAAHPVYCHKCWWSEEWEPRDYGRPFDPARPLLEQFFELRSQVPQPAMMNDNTVASENCEYCHDFSFGKNCYLVTASWQVEDTMYCTQCNYVRQGCDSLIVSGNSELFYECVGCEKLYACSFLSLCSGCANCHFGYDLRGCTDCIGCAGLRQQRYCIFNVQYTADEFQSLAADMKMETFSGQARVQAQFSDFMRTIPRKAAQQIQCENCVGDLLFHCRNFDGFGMIDAEDCRFMWQGDAPRHCYDIIHTGKPEWCYEGITPDNSYLTSFTTWCWKDKYVLYSDNCHSCEQLLGCIALRREGYCILNRRYSAEEYERLAAEIIGGMQAEGEWGEFFPMEHAPFAYNESRAFEMFSLSAEDARSQGLNWYPAPPRPAKPGSYSTPDSINDVADTVTAETLACADCAKNYRIIPQELKFYRQLALPLPRECPACRRSRRFSGRHALGKLFKRRCSGCAVEIMSVYPADAPEIVYCEGCYLEGLH